MIKSSILPQPRSGFLVVVAAALLLVGCSGRTLPPAGATAPVSRGSGAAAHWTLPADTTAGIHLAQAFNYREPVVDGIKQGEAGVLDYVWGADRDARNVPGGRRVWHETYIPWGIDPQQRSLSWWLANHPSWVLYKEDRVTPAMNTNDTGVQTPALDMSNPRVQAWVAKQAETRLARGFEGVSWDDTVVYNKDGAAGHYDTHRRWVQQYEGRLIDPVYGAAQAAAFAAVIAAVRAVDPNTSTTLNQRFKCDSVWRMTASTPDMILDEGGFTYTADKGTYLTTAPDDGCSNAWLQTIHEYEYLQSVRGQGLVLLNSESWYRVRPYMTDRDARARADLQWALANYLLIKYAHTYFWWGSVQQEGGGPPIPQHELSAPVGSPTNTLYAAQGVYMRNYTNGMAVVNPDPSRTLIVKLASGYRNLYGHGVTQLVMPPHSGDVLIHRCEPRGCHASHRPTAADAVGRSTRPRLVA